MKKQKHREKRIPLNLSAVHGMLIAAAFFWGINPMIMKIALEEISPLPFNTFRLIFAFILSGLMLILNGGWQSMPVSDFLRLVRVSLFGFFIFQAGYTFGVHYTAAGIAAIILAMLPVFVVIINYITKLESFTMIAVIGMVVTFLGVLFITFGGSSEMTTGSTYLIGVLLLLIAEFAYGGYTVFVKRLLSDYTLSQVMLITVGISLILFFLISIPSLYTIQYREISVRAWLSIVYSGAFGIFAGNFLWNIGVKQIGSTNTSVYINLTPIFGIIAGYLFLNEILTWLQLLGAIIILLGVYIVNSRNRPTKYHKY